MSSSWDQEEQFGAPDEAEMELRIWEYIDGLASDEARSKTESMLVAHAAWRAKYKELLEVHQMIGSAELEQPSMRFTRNVMEEISRLQIGPATKAYINKKIIWGIAGFFITVIAGFLVYALSQVAWSTGTSGSAFGGVDFGQVDYSRIFSNNFVNGFMALNIILGLFLLDRYLGQQKKGWQQ